MSLIVLFQAPAEGSPQTANPAAAVAAWAIPAPTILTAVTAEPSSATRTWVVSAPTIAVGSTSATASPAIRSFSIPLGTTAAHVLPSNLSGLRLWLDVGYAGGELGLGSDDDVSVVKDRSGNGVTFTSVSNPPRYWPLNNYQGQNLTYGAEFSAGNEEQLVSASGVNIGTVTDPDFVTNDNFTLFVVAQFPTDEISGLGPLFTIDSGDNFEGISLKASDLSDVVVLRWGDFSNRIENTIGSVVANRATVFTVRRDEGAGLFSTFKNGTPGVDNNASGAWDPASGTTQVQLGYDSETGAFASANIAEVIWYSRALNTTERQQIERYLLSRHETVEIASDSDGPVVLPNPAVATWTVPAATASSVLTGQPAAAQSVWNTPTPVSVLGGVTAAPSAATEAWSTPSASVSVGAVVAAPRGGSNAWSTNTPIIVLGSVTAAPAAAVCAAVAVTPAVVLSLTISVTAAINPWVATSPSSVLGGVTGAAPPATNPWASPTATTSTGAATAAPNAGAAPWTVPAATAAIGTVVATPAGAISAWNVPAATATSTTVALPAPAVSTSTAATPIVVLGGITVVSGAQSAWTTVTPTSTVGALTTTGTTAVAPWTVPSPTATLGSVTATPNAAVNTSVAAAPTITLGGVSPSVAVAQAAWTQPLSTASLGAVTITASTGSSAWSVPAATGARGATFPDPAASTWVVSQVAVVLGGNTPVLTAASTGFSATTPQVTLAVTATPAAAVAAWQVGTPSAGVFTTPLPATEAWTVPNCTIALGGLVAGPQAASNQWGTSAPATQTTLVVTTTPASTTWQAPSPSSDNTVSVTSDSAPSVWQVLAVTTGLQLTVAPLPATSTWGILPVDSNNEGFRTPETAITTWTANDANPVVLPSVSIADPAIQPFICNAPVVTVGPMEFTPTAATEVWILPAQTAYVGLEGTVELRPTVEGATETYPMLVVEGTLQTRPTTEASVAVRETIVARLKTRKP
jgi:hypothetical protein